MLDKLTNAMDFHTKALVLRSERQRVIAGNIANADTPGFAARDSNFADALREASGSSGGTYSTASLAGTASAGANGVSHPRHIPLGSGSGGSASGGADGEQGYVVQTQPRLDGNSVDLDRERAAFADNAVRYEATLRFINGQGKTMLAAITGQ